MKFFQVILLLSLAAWARLSVEMNPRSVEQGQNFTFALVMPLTELPKKYEFPEIQGTGKAFKILKTQEKDEVTRDFFGRRSRVRKFIFSMKALKMGRQSIGPILWKINGQVQDLGTQSIDIGRSLDASGLRIRTSTSKKTFYKGQQIPIALSMTFFENYGGELNLQPKSLGRDFTGNFSQDELKTVRSEKAGVRATARRKGYFVALRSGDLTLPSLEYSYQKIGRPKTVTKTSKKGGFSYSESRTEQQPIDAIAKTKPLALKILPLPANAPTSFKGLVGSYSMTTKLGQDTVKVGDALTLNITIKGDGRPGAMPDLQFPDLPDFRSIPPEVKTNTRKVNSKLHTTRSYKFFLYPKREGSFTLPQLEFSYFDVRQKKYVTLQSQAKTFFATPGVSSATPQGLVSSSGPSLVTEKTDIRYLDQDLSKPSQESKTSLWWHLPFWILLLLLYPCVQLWQKGRAKKNADVIGKRRNNSKSKAQKHLASAQANKSSDLFYKELSHAIQGFLSDQLNQEFIGKTELQAKESLLSSGASEELCGDYKALMQKCEYAQFAGAGILEAERQEDWEKAKLFLENVEKAL